MVILKHAQVCHQNNVIDMGDVDDFRTVAPMAAHIFFSFLLFNCLQAKGRETLTEFFQGTNLFTVGQLGQHAHFV